MRWVGWMMLAAGAPLSILGVAQELEIGKTISVLNSSTKTESTYVDVAWVRSTYWYSPYMLWFGFVLMVSGGVLGFVRPLFSGKSDSSVDRSVDDERYLNP